VVSPLVEALRGVEVAISRLEKQLGIAVSAVRVVDECVTSPQS
jgi:hypothetical protein